MSTSFQELTAEQRNAFASRVVTQFARPRMPSLRLVELFLTDNCTLRCDYCFVEDKSPSRMSWQVARKAVDFLMDGSEGQEAVEITFFGGEPLMEFELLKQVVAYSEKRATGLGKKISFTITTNGTIMNEEIARFGREYDFNYLLSIDGEREAHDKHRIFPGKRGGSWNVVTGDNLRLLKSIQGWLGTRMTVNPDTASHLSSGVRTLFESGVNQFIIGPNVDAEWTQEDMRTYAAELCSVRDFYLDAKARGLPIRINSLDDTVQNKYCPGIWGCDAGRTRIAVTTDGDLYPCTRFIGASPRLEAYKLGNVDEGITNVGTRMDFILNGEDKRPKCAACDIRDYCAGGCPGISAVQTGSLFNPNSFECFSAKLAHELARSASGSASQTL